LKYSTGKTLAQQFRRTGNIDRQKQQRAYKHLIMGTEYEKILDGTSMQDKEALVRREHLDEIINTSGLSYSDDGRTLPMTSINASIERLIS
jgi:hypothetical protein